MIPTIAKKGTSFKGAALYYLHDKNALTNDRVEFAQTHNLATDSPEIAWKMMAFTALHQSEIKQAAGGASKGRKLTQPVYAYSLSWHPTQKPTKEQMVNAGLVTLKALGLGEHEAILVAHNDEPHSHLHLVVNRVHPETGIAAKLSNDRLNLSKWAEKYELEQGQIFCDKRVENNKRRKSEYVKYREAQNKAEFYRWQREKVNRACDQRQEDSKSLSSIHKKQRDTLFIAKERLVEHCRNEIKESNLPKWASLYKQQNQEKLNLDTMKDDGLSRLAGYIKNRNHDRKHGTLDIKRGLLTGSFNAVIDHDTLSKVQIKKHERERKVFAGRIIEETRNSLKNINKGYIRDLENMKVVQAKESWLMKSRHSAESQRQAKDIASGKTKEEFNRIKRTEILRDKYNKKSQEKPTGLKSEFNDKVDFRVARYMKQEREKINNSNVEKTDKPKTEFDKASDFRIKRYMKADNEREETTNLKDEFNKKKLPSPDIQKDFRIARYMKKQQESENPDNLKKPTEIKKGDRAYRYINDNSKAERNNTQKKGSTVKEEFNKSQKLLNNQEQEQTSNRDTSRDIGKDAGMDRER
ncbi:MAG: relaxase/mobilization nuclease domain-containing protein [Candidatus Scalindua sp.]|jgi:hypothetical protein|nr:relaxase/mobilization nuclease domain-containing protein [Candidatus Scalindua sp.]MBT6231081.1 relaxase/mobilization nuclease domain-containing protein [Candidatus Scalindua sp.]MBT6564451.1 relaxase/mobilization nuclease domain-containing protein [Candidatus Scalindua sp.]